MSEIQDLPPIDPTGAMSSGEYTEYMIYYNNLAEDVISENLTKYQVASTIEDWYLLWGRIIADVNLRTEKLESSLTALNQQILVVDTQIRNK